VGLAISVFTLYLNQRRTKKELELAKEYIQILSKLVESYKKGMESQQQLEKEKLQWQKLEGIGKLLGWVVEHAGEE